MYANVWNKKLLETIKLSQFVCSEYLTSDHRRYMEIELLSFNKTNGIIKGNFGKTIHIRNQNKKT